MMVHALAVQRWCVEQAREHLGDEHPSTLNSMNNLALMLGAIGDHRGACRLQEQVLKSNLRLLDLEHPDTLRSLNNLAGTLAAMGELKDARGLQEAW